ncbi:SRPBCC family protein [Halorubellus salinus]|uniref:SRPBCC family protein n=1 Tax=Halorubellus salinus TaxID=755309 RepID=UPI001D08A743|nr:SRPBCC family protein [Halorubellus salinus]
MIETSHDVHVDVPVSDVFAYMDQPANQPEITPSLQRSEILAAREDGSKRVAYGYGLGGITMDGELDAVEYVPEERIVWEMTGDLSGEITWTFEPEDGGTRFTYAAGYDVPGGVLERLAAPFVKRYNDREVRTTLENLKTRLEHDAADDT